MAKKDTTKKAVTKPKRTLSKESVQTLEKMHIVVPELLKEELIPSITAKFKITEIKMSSDFRWSVQMVVTGRLHETKSDYKMKLEFNDEPFLNTVKALEKDIKDIEENPTLLQSIDNEKINHLNHRIDDTKREMNDLKKECEDIDFIAQTSKCEFTGNTKIVFFIIDSVVEQLNKQKYKFDKYRVVLETI